LFSSTNHQTPNAAQEQTLIQQQNTIQEDMIHLASQHQHAMEIQLVGFQEHDFKKKCYPITQQIFTKSAI